MFQSYIVPEKEYMSFKEYKKIGIQKNIYLKILYLIKLVRTKGLNILQTLKL